MVRDAGATRRRLLDAAATEFSERGLAGARVDRIAAAARSNKAQIYHYFGSKDGLFDAVFDEIVARTLREVPIDPANLPEYAGRLFDGYQSHPQVQRIAAWHRLERGDHPVAAITASNQSKIDAIARATEDGAIPPRWDPAVLLALVLGLSSVWATMTPELESSLESLPAADRRQVVVDAVAALLA